MICEERNLNTELIARDSSVRGRFNGINVLPKNEMKISHTARYIYSIVAIHMLVIGILEYRY